MESQALTELQEHLETFRKEFYSVNVKVFANCLGYKVGNGFSDVVTKEANELIQKLNLPLIAQGTTTHTKDSFIIKSK